VFERHSGRIQNYATKERQFGESRQTAGVKKCMG